MARGQGHLLQVRRVPRRQDDPPVIGVVLELVDDLGQLVDALPRVVRLRIDVLGAKVPPLKAVDGAQVADLAVGEADAVQELARPVAIPDLDARLAQREGGCVGLDEPEELGDDGPGEDALGGEQGQDGCAVTVKSEL